jgi:GAF domain-containing protein
LLARGVRSLMLVPLLTRENNLGFAVLESLAGRPPLADDEINLCMTIAAQVAIAVQNAGLFDQNSRRARRERLINEITERIRRAVDVPGVLAATANELGAALGARRAHVEISLPPAPAPASGGNGSAARPRGGNGREAAS